MAVYHLIQNNFKPWWSTPMSIPNNTRAPAPDNNDARAELERRAALAPKKLRFLEGTSDERKTWPVTSGVLDYFPDAVAAVAEISYWGNQKHNPGEPLHWARGKSMDHADCIARHLIERGGFDTLTVNGKQVRLRHSAALAWRALANLQMELEAELGLAPPRNAR